MPLVRGTQYASVTIKQGPMHDPAFATRVCEHVAAFMVQPFSVADAAKLVEEKCGRFVRGAHKGALRGWGYIEVVTEGGWKRHGPGQGNGRVVYPGTVLSVTIRDFDGRAYLEVA